jgi:hypothetical protein
MHMLHLRSGCFTSPLYPLIPATITTHMVVMQTSEVEATLVPLNEGSLNVVQYMYLTFSGSIFLLCETIIWWQTHYYSAMLVVVLSM